jgi:hypothetical protein
MKWVLMATELLLLHELTEVGLYGRDYVSAKLWKAAVEGLVVLKQTSAEAVDATALQTLSTEAAGGIRLNIQYIQEVLAKRPEKLRVMDVSNICRTFHKQRNMLVSSSINIVTILGSETRHSTRDTKNLEHRSTQNLEPPKQKLL